jgi:hypothetical protein
MMNTRLLHNQSSSSDFFYLIELSYHPIPVTYGLEGQEICVVRISLFLLMAYLSSLFALYDIHSVTHVRSSILMKSIDLH